MGEVGSEEKRKKMEMKKKTNTEVCRKNVLLTLVFNSIVPKLSQGSWGLSGAEANN